jgi:ankyrin repeat protein
MKNEQKQQQHSRRNFIKLISTASAVIYTPFVLGKSPQNIIPTILLGEESDKNSFLNACKNGNLDLVKTLLSTHQEFLNIKDHIGRTGFAIALLNNHKDISEYLKESGYLTDLHETVLDLNWDRYNQLVGEESEETINQINSDHPIGGSTMWAAAKSGAGQDMWRVYANCGNPNLNTKNKGGSTPLQQALRYPNLKIAELTAAALLSNNTNPNPSPNAEMPPLHLAAERGSYEMVEMLIRLGADVNEKNENGKSALQLSEYFGHESVVDLLNNHKKIPRTCRTSRIAFNIDGDQYKKADMSNIPIYKQGNIVGLAHRNIEALEKAIKLDSRMAHSVATTSEICVEAGAHMGRKDIVELLTKNGAPYSLPTAVMMNDFTNVKRMLDEDPKRIHERGAHDFALLWYPIIGGGNIEMTELLLNRGAKVEEQHFLGTTALHWACFKGPIELVELLINNGANVNRLGRKFIPEGETPLQSTNDEKIINYLKSKGAI